MKSGHRIIMHMLPDKKFTLPEITERSHMYMLSPTMLGIMDLTPLYEPAPKVDFWNKSAWKKPTSTDAITFSRGSL